MFKILLALLLMTVPAWSQQWRNGVAEQTILGTSQAALIGFNSYNKIVLPLDNLLATYCNEYLTYTSSTTITVSSGSCVVSSSASTPIRLFLLDPANTILSSANLDTGSLTASTTYYVYSTAATNTSTSSTYFISASNTAPSGQTYYYQIGSFTTDANIQITNIINNRRTNQFNTTISKSANVVYQALTDGFVEGVGNQTSGNSIFSGLTGSISGSMTTVQSCGGSSQSGNSCPIFFAVRRGDYWEVTANSATVYYLSTSN